jgi:tRNA-specific 2-thiouridylase
VPDGDYAKIVEAIRPEGGISGAIVHAETGEQLGQHKGVIHYTVGQRRGLDLGGLSEPFYVVGIDADKREVKVGPRRLLAVSSAQIIETNAIGPLPGGDLTAKVRSLAKPVPVELDRTAEGQGWGTGGAVTLRFAQAELGVAPGQAAVIYAGQRVVGGGWIDSTQ